MHAPRIGTVPTGIPGFDILLHGGLAAGRMYLVEGRPGTGKTTFALQFCRAGVEAGERVLYVTLSQRAEELCEIAASHGWSLDGVDLLDSQSDGLDLHATDHTLFDASSIDLVDIVDTVLRRVEETKPSRLVLDSAAEIRLLAGEQLRSRRRFLLLKHALGEAGVTTLVLDDYSSQRGESGVHSIMHGVFRLEREAPQYGHLYRRLQVVKIRGVDNPTGHHDFRIVPGGIAVYPSLTMYLEDEGRDEDGPAEESAALGPARSGVANLDDMLHGGLDRGSSCVVVGVSGTGKSSLAASYAVAAAERGERAAIYTFDERKRALLDRMEGLGFGVRALCEEGTLEVSEFSPSIMTTGRFVDRVRREVEAGLRLVVIDSLTGFTHACPGAQRAVTQLHDLLAYLGARGVVTLITVPQHGLIGDSVSPQVDVSYIADTVLMLQHFEVEGRVRKALAVVKRRRGGADPYVRDFVLSDGGITVGDEITAYSGVLRGSPTAQC